MRKSAVRIALIGYGFMGRAHSHALGVMGRLFPAAVAAETVLVCGPHRESAKTFGARWGWPEVCTDWREAVERDDIDAVDIATPSSVHAVIGEAALAHGKHVFCEKPLANSLEDAQRLAAVAKTSGQVHMVGFNYRRVPALALAREWIASGKLGAIHHFQAQYLQDWAANDQTPYSWRFSRDIAGSGALGDLGSHVIDLGRYLVGEMKTVSAQTNIVVPHHGGDEGTQPVTVDDAAMFLIRFESGAAGMVDVSRVATGRKNRLRLEIYGSQGALAFDLERLNELEVWWNKDRPHDGWQRILVTNAAHPYMRGWWPDGHALGWDATFVHEMHDWIAACGTGAEVRPDFDDGLRCQAVIDAVLCSAANHRAVDIVR